MTSPPVPTIPDHVDPITQVQLALKAKIAAHDGLARAIKAGNRRTRGENDRKPNRLDADFPGLEVIPAGFTSNFHASSTSGLVEKTYQVAIASGSMDEKVMNVVEWQLWRFFGALPSNGDLGLPFVHRVALVSGDEEPEVRHGTDQWTVIGNVVVAMRFSRQADLQAATPALTGV